MKRALWFIVVAGVCVLPARAQIESQATTYELTLDECLARTFAHSPDISRLRQDVERAAGDKLVFSSRAWSQLAAQVQGGYRAGSLFDKSEPFSVLTAQFSQPVLDRAIPASLHRGEVEVIIAQQNLNREVTDRLYEARYTFLQVLYYRELIALYDQIHARLLANVANEQHRFDAGLGDRGTLMQAKLQPLNLERDLAQMRAEYFNAVTRLAELCREDLSAETNGTRQVRLPHPTGSLTYTPVTLDPTRDAGLAQHRRADVQLLRALVDAAEADRRTTTAGYWPVISAVASGLFIPEDVLLSRQTDIVAGQQTHASEIRAGAALTWRVIDNGEVTGAARRMEAIRQGYEVVLRKLEQDIPRELARIAGTLESADARREALSRSADAAEENLKQIESRAALGEATQYDLLRAQNDLLFVRAGIVDATFQHEAARAEWDRATGRYLEFAGTTTP